MRYPNANSPLTGGYANTLTQDRGVLEKRYAKKVSVLQSCSSLFLQAYVQRKFGITPCRKDINPRERAVREFLYLSALGKYFASYRAADSTMNVPTPLRLEGEAVFVSYIDNSRTLSEEISTGHSMGSSDIALLQKRYGETAGRLMTRGICLTDYHPGNVLVRRKESGVECFLIDLELAQGDIGAFLKGENTLLWERELRPHCTGRKIRDYYADIAGALADSCGLIGRQEDVLAYATNFLEGLTIGYPEVDMQRMGEILKGCYGVFLLKSVHGEIIRGSKGGMAPGTRIRRFLRNYPSLMEMM